MIARRDVEETVSHSEEAEMSFICSARSDDSTPVNSTWYRLEWDHFTGELYEARVENRSAERYIIATKAHIDIFRASDSCLMLDYMCTL